MSEMICFAKIVVLVAPLLVPSLQEQLTLDDGWSADSDHENWKLEPFPTWKPFPTFPTFPTIPWPYESDSDSSDSDSDADLLCELPILKNGILNVTQPLKIGEWCSLSCDTGYCLCDHQDHNKSANITEFQCTEKLAEEDEYCNLPSCERDIGYDPDAPLQYLTNKVSMVKQYLKDGFADYQMTWHRPYEDYAERFLGSPAEIPPARCEVLKFLGQGLCNRHLATGYFNAWGSSIKRDYYGGYVGCAVSSGTRNVIACVLYK